MDNTIIVEGHGKFDLDKVKATVVNIAGNYYFKHDRERVVPLKNGLVKVRYYRVNSPLVVKEESTGSLCLKTDCFLTEDGVYLDKKSPYVVNIGSKYYRSAYCVTIDGETYLKTDPRLLQDHERGRYIVKDKATKLSEKYYKKFPWCQNTTKTVTTVDGDVILEQDMLHYFDIFTQSRVIAHKSLSNKERLCNIVIDFQDKTNPQEDRLENIYAIEKHVAAELSVENGKVRRFSFFNDGIYINIPASRLEYFTECTNKYIMPRVLTKLEEIRKSINNNYSDQDGYENTAPRFKIINRPFAGKQQIFTPNNTKPILSKTFVKTGGLEYSFGLEFETSQGLISRHELLDELRVSCVGDRSIGAGEYVTSPLMGDSGLQVVEQLCSLLNSETLVDDRCGLHVHVGSLFQPKKEGDKPKAIQAPSFDKQFLMNAINLGAFIEEELYSTLPVNRKPTLYHCHSIRRFAPCTVDNFNVNFGAYIFGPKEWWLEPTQNCPEKLFKFKNYELSSERNQNSRLGNWADGRYKWLNLIPSYTSGKPRTIEFRIFSGTTSFEKVYAFLLTSMAFTYVIDNCHTIIKKGVTLSSLFHATCPDNPELVLFLDSFYDARKNKFKRTNIYGGLDLPFLK